MKKKIMIGAVALVVLIIIIIAIVAHAPKVNCNDPGFAPYISAYTDGTVSKTQPIRVVLNSELAEKVNRNADADGLIKVYPKANGKCVFVDERTIEFTPDGNFSSGKDYVFSFNLGKIADVPGLKENT